MSGGGMGKAQILVADDDADLRETVAFALCRRQYQVEAVADGRAALEQMRQARPALVLLDLTMPHLDGRGFLSACQADPVLAAVPVVLMTGGPEQAEALCAAGQAQAVLRKPFTISQLLSTVSRVLAEH